MGEPAGNNGGDTPESARLRKQEWATLTLLTLSTFFVLVDSTVVNIAVPVMVEHLGGRLDEATWTLVGR